MQMHAQTLKVVQPSLSASQSAGYADFPLISSVVQPSLSASQSAGYADFPLISSVSLSLLQPN